VSLTAGPATHAAPDGPDPPDLARPTPLL